jgi:hypothetical protein
MFEFKSNAIQISEISKLSDTLLTYEANWSATTSEGAIQKVEDLLSSQGCELDATSAGSGIYDERGRDATRLEVAHGTLHFRPTARAWVIPQLPLDWVVEYEGKLWIVPARINGWKQKLPYKGYHPDKIPTAERAKNYMLISLGAPKIAEPKEQYV